MALRARGKARRYAEIVGAAADLWREHGLDKVSLSQIAAAAEVSPQTIYNLIGGLDAVGLAVINVAMNRVESLLSRASATNLSPGRRAAGPWGRIMKFSHRARPVWYLTRSTRP